MEDVCRQVPFTIHNPEFDMDTFTGRFRSFMRVSNPVHAFYSNKRIREFQKMIEDQKEKEEKYF